MSGLFHERDLTDIIVTTSSFFIINLQNFFFPWTANVALICILYITFTSFLGLIHAAHAAA